MSEKNQMNGSYEAPAIRCIVINIDPVMAGSAPAELEPNTYLDWGGEKLVEW